MAVNLFVESMIRFNELILESDEELRRLERRVSADPKDKAAATQLIRAKERAGHYPSKTHREVDEYKYGLKSLERIHPDLLKKAHDAAQADATTARENYRMSDVPRHERRRKMFADRLDSSPDFNAPNAAQQLHAWKRYMGLGNRLNKLSDRRVWRSVNTDRLVHKFGSEQGKHARRDPRGFANTRTGQSPMMSAFDAARERYIRLRDNIGKPTHESLDDDYRKAERAVKADPSDKEARSRFDTFRLRKGMGFEGPRKQPSTYRRASLGDQNGRWRSTLDNRINNAQDKIYHINSLERLISKHNLSPEEILRRHDEIPITQHLDKAQSERYLKLTPEQRANMKERLDFISHRAGARRGELYARHWARRPSGSIRYTNAAAHQERARKLARLGGHLVKKYPNLPREMIERIWHLGKKANAHSTDAQREGYRMGQHHKTMYPPEIWDQEEPKDWRAATRGKLISKRGS